MYVIKYFIITNLFALLAWPIAKQLFGKFPDKGWVFSKILGYLLTAWLVWLLSSLQILAFSNLSILLVTIGLFIAIWLTGSVFQLSLVKSNFYQCYSLFFTKQRNYFTIISEIVFLIIFSLWCEIVSYNPELFGLEKFMDFGFILSAYKTEYFPPLDHFFAGETINYYYFGHYIAAFFTKITSVEPTISYNLHMSFIVAISCVTCFSLGAAIGKGCGFKNSKIILAGLLSSLLVNFSGNLQYFAHLVAKYFNKLLGTNLDLLLSTERIYHYPSATRFIPGTIHEFPLYSYVVNDLHAHVNNIPTVILVIALFYVGFSSLNKQPKLKTSIRYLLICALVIGTCYASNAWDFAIYLLLFGFSAIVYFTVGRKASLLNSLCHYQTILRCGIVSLFVLSVSIILFLPFWLNMHPPAQGVGFVPLEKTSDFYQLLILWGLHLFFIIYYFRFSDSSNQTKAEHLFIKLLLFMGLFLIILPEIIYVKDLFDNGKYFRANTMFKLVYQSWIIMGIALGPVIVFLFGRLNSWNGIIFKLLTCFILLCGFSYTVNAVKKGCHLQGKKKGLDGFTFLNRREADDLKVIKWMNSNISGQPVIVEAVNKSYSIYARVSSFTGFPTVLGWPNHEWTWRGSYNESVKPTSTYEKKHKRKDSVKSRKDAVKQFYETKEVKLAKKFLDDYQVELIYIGNLERKQYPDIQEEKIQQLATLLHRDGDSAIFQVKK